MLTKILVGIGLIAIQFVLDQLVRRIESERMAINPKLKKICMAIAYISDVALDILSVLSISS